MKKSKSASAPIPTYNWGHNRQVFTVEGPSMTKQSFAKDCDVNEIVKRFDRTGLITHLQKSEAVFADVSEIGSYQEAVQTVQQAQEAFLKLPSGLRSHFGNDPASYLDWSTSASLEERQELYNGLTGKDRYAEPVTPPAATPQTEPETGD